MLRSSLFFLSLFSFFGFTDCRSAPLLPNGSFDRVRDGVPVGWRVGSGNGRWESSLGRGGTGCITCSPGKGESSFWRASVEGLKPGRVYAFSFYGKLLRPGGGGCIVSGPENLNHDFQVESKWTRCEFAFPLPPSWKGPVRFRLGTWKKDAVVGFDDARLTPVAVFNKRRGGVELGEGEKINGRRYSFRARLDGYLGAWSRPLYDFNCGFKAYRKKVTKSLDLYGQMHRYIPVIVGNQGYKITEIPVHHRQRKYGRSKYGPVRFLNGFLDLLTVMVLTRYFKRPAHFFGGLGTLAFGAGFIIGMYVTYLRFVYGSIQGRLPLFIAGILLIMVGIQLISLGLIGEMFVKIGGKKDNFVKIRRITKKTTLPELYSKG